VKFQIVILGNEGNELNVSILSTIIEANPVMIELSTNITIIFFDEISTVKMCYVYIKIKIKYLYF